MLQLLERSFDFVRQYSVPYVRCRKWFGQVASKSCSFTYRLQIALVVVESLSLLCLHWHRMGIQYSWGSYTRRRRIAYNYQVSRNGRPDGLPFDWYMAPDFTQASQADEWLILYLIWTMMGWPVMSSFRFPCKCNKVNNCLFLIHLSIRSLLSLAWDSKYVTSLFVWVFVSWETVPFCTCISKRGQVSLPLTEDQNC